MGLGGAMGFQRVQEAGELRSGKEKRLSRNEWLQTRRKDPPPVLQTAVRSVFLNSPCRIRAIIRKTFVKVVKEQLSVRVCCAPGRCPPPPRSSAHSLSRHDFPAGGARNPGPFQRGFCLGSNTVSQSPLNPQHLVPGGASIC